MLWIVVHEPFWLEFTSATYCFTVTLFISGPKSAKPCFMKVENRVRMSSLVHIHGGSNKRTFQHSAGSDWPNCKFPSQNLFQGHVETDRMRSKSKPESTHSPKNLHKGVEKSDGIATEKPSWTFTLLLEDPSSTGESSFPQGTLKRHGGTVDAHFTAEKHNIATLNARAHH